MKVARLIAPYDCCGHTNLGFTKERSGVYMIYKNGTLRYVGYSATNLYKTVTRHFQGWKDKNQKRVTYKDQLTPRNDFKVRIILCTPSRAEKLERGLIVKYKPGDNPDKLRSYTPTSYENKIVEDFEFTRVLTAAQMAALEAAPF